jgi:hypothetical protein
MDDVEMLFYTQNNDDMMSMDDENLIKGVQKGGQKPGQKGKF